MNLIRPAALLLTVFQCASYASTVRWNMPVTGAFGVTASFTESPDGSIRGAVELTPGARTADIVAVYIQLREPALMPLPAPLRRIADAVEGVHVTQRQILTSNVQSGNMGAVYSLGFAIGTEGIGKDDIQSAALLFRTPGLRLEHIESVAIRLTSVGTFAGPRNGSLKLTSGTPEWILTPIGRQPSADAPVPEPGTFLLAGVALVGVGLAGCRRRRNRLPHDTK